MKTLNRNLLTLAIIFLASIAVGQYAGLPSYGGSASEIYWRDAGTGYIFESQPIQNPDGGASLTVRNNVTVTNGTRTAAILTNGASTYFYGDIAGGGYLQWNTSVWNFSSSGTSALNTLTGGLSSNAASGVNAFGATTNGARFDIGAGSTDYISSDGTNILSAAPLAAPAGTFALPSITLSGDLNTGLYSVGADQLGVTTAGARSFSFSATAGKLEGAGANTSLTMDGTNINLDTSSQYVRVNGNITRTSGRSSVTVEDAEGLSIVSANSTAFPASGAGEATLLLADTFTSRLFFRRSTTNATSPPYDIGGAPHSVLQQKEYVLDMGNNSAATPTFMAAPRASGGTITVTVVDGAAAGGILMGSGVDVHGYRVSNTSAVSGNISSLTNSAVWVSPLQAPRWCQRVGIGNAAGGALATMRVWVGLASALPGASDAPATSNAGFRFSTAASDTFWMYCYGAGSTTCTSTGVAPPANAAGFGASDLLCVDCRESGACTWWVNGIAKARVATGIPTATMTPIYSIETLTTAAKYLGAGDISIEQN